MISGKKKDWVDGEAAISYQRCSKCKHVWYFRRNFCPGCGMRDVTMLRATGIGRIYALSLVHRAPSEELSTLVPYLVVLVDMEEGFRMMAHADRSLEIGDRVRACYIEFGGRLVPHFKKERT